MSEVLAGKPVRERLDVEVAHMAGRLAGWLRQALPGEGQVAEAIAFLDAVHRGVTGDAPPGAWEAERDTPPDHPIGRLAASLALTRTEVDLLILAGLPDEHEGLADVLRTIHPRNEPRATVGLAAQLFCPSPGHRHELRRLLSSGSAVKSGVVRVQNEGPFFGCNLELVDALWATLCGVDAWPAGLRPVAECATAPGLEGWLRSNGLRPARRALELGLRCTLLVTAHDPEAALHRAAALVAGSGRRATSIHFPVDVAAELEAQVLAHTIGRGTVPVLGLERADGPKVPAAPPFALLEGPLVVAGQTGACRLTGDRPVLEVPTEKLEAASLRSMWGALLPGLADESARLAARHPLEPHLATLVARDVEALEMTEERRPTPADVSRCVRVRAGSNLAKGVKLARPAARWEHLVLPERHLRQLREAVNRLHHQSRVLDDWGFLEGRRGARGVRMLFSGPPGTGKTLAAEVLASELEADAVLVVDLSRVVSKWLGETEKNLSQVFDAAERAQAVLQIDEADALFGKRTEITDAHDRYANLETAYLLARLESFDGLAILSTNLRQNIDPAFLRRLEFQVDFNEPEVEERERLWRVHLPDRAPVSEDVDLRQLAALYPLVGGLIRNAAVAAGFLAAADGQRITWAHFVHAVRREYDKTGKAFPGLPPNMAACEKGR